MHEASPTLAVQKRERLGSRYAKRDRNAGRLPAIVYGHKIDPVAITLDAKETITHLSKGEKVFEFDLDGKKQHVLLRDLGYDYLGTNIIHADFARVDLDERVNTKAHIHLVGEAVGLKEVRTVLMHPVTELELNCVVTNLPDEIRVDITDLEAGGSIKAGDIKLPFDTMVLLTDPDAIVAHVVVQAEQMEETDEEGEVSADAAEPEVISEKKDDDEKKED